MAISSKGWLTWSLILACWTLIALIDSAQIYIYLSVKGHPIGWGQAVAESFAIWYAWAALAPFILYFARRFQFNRRHWRRVLLVHFAASLCLSLIHVTLHTFLDQILIHGYFDTNKLAISFSAFFARRFHLGVLIYWAIVGLTHAFDYYKDREIAASQMQAQLAQAQLQALKMQLHPHFLFNTLHAIAALMRQDIQAADRMLSLLSELLRMSLATSDAQEVTLMQELEFLDTYLEIEKTRFQERLVILKNVEPEVLDANVPSLVLQPLVENSIRHGINKRRGVGVIQICALRHNGMLRLQVRDNGVGFPTDKLTAIKEGVGLANTRARLVQLYGEDYRFTLKNQQPEGLVVTLEIPYKQSG